MRGGKGGLGRRLEERAARSVRLVARAKRPKKPHDKGERGLRGHGKPPRGCKQGRKRPSRSAVKEKVLISGSIGCALTLKICMEV